MRCRHTKKVLVGFFHFDLKFLFLADIYSRPVFKCNRCDKRCIGGIPSVKSIWLTKDEMREYDKTTIFPEIE